MRGTSIQYDSDLVTTSTIDIVVLLQLSKIRAVASLGARHAHVSTENELETKALTSRGGSFQLPQFVKSDHKINAHSCSEKLQLVMTAFYHPDFVEI